MCRTPAARVLVLLVFLILGACRSEPSAVVDIDVLDLIRPNLLPGDPAVIDFGSPESESFLAAGWSPPDRTSEGDSVAWIDGPSAELRLSLGVSVNRTMVIRAAAPGGGRRTVLQLRLNRRLLPSVRLSPQMSEHTVEIPARLQLRGENRLTLAAGSRRVPIGRAPKPIVAVDLIRWRGSEDQRPSVAIENDSLHLLPPTDIRFYLRLPSEPMLAFTAEGKSAESNLAVHVGAPDRSAQVLRPATRNGMQSIDLRDYSGQLAEIRLEAGGGAPMRLSNLHVAGRLTREKPPLDAAAARGANVLLYVIDTLRADHLGCYGYSRPTSPHIDGFAGGATLFESAVAQSSWTRPAVGALLTGMNPPSHWAMSLRDSLRPDAPTLAQALQTGGYRTAAFVTNFNVSNRWGFDRGFDEFRYLPEDERSAGVHVAADLVNREALDWLRRHRQANAAQPFFMWMHVTDPHAPYNPVEPFAARFRRLAATRELKFGQLRDHPERAKADDVVQLIDAYDAEIAFVDHAFGELLKEIERLGLSEDTVVVLTSDHGEEFLDHGGFEHGRTLYQEQLHVPFILRMPQGAGQGARVASLVRQIDLMPTLLQLLDLPVPASLDGRSLLEGGEPSSGAFAQTSLGYHETRAFVTDQWKVIVNNHKNRPPEEAYCLTADPKEKDDRAAVEALRVGYARQAISIAAAPGTTRPQAAATLDPATEERLRALGYVD
jgi:arylsulfatase A-like enzyme